jgi:hypothetical protein
VCAGLRILHNPAEGSKRENVPVRELYWTVRRKVSQAAGTRAPDRRPQRLSPWLRYRRANAGSIIAFLMAPLRLF